MSRLTSGHLSEQHGFALADSALTGMQAAPDQAERSDILHAALLELQKTKRLARFIQLCFTLGSIGRALWVSDYERYQPRHGK